MILNIAPSVDFSLLLAAEEVEKLDENKPDLEDGITNFIYSRFKENGVPPNEK